MFQSSMQKADAVVVEDDYNDKNAGKTIIHPMEQETAGDDENIPFVKGELQPLEYRDVNYARAFYFQLLAVIGIAIWYGPAAFAASTDNTPTTTTTGNDDSISSFSMTTFFAILVTSLLASAIGTAGFLTLMMNRTECILKVSFFLAPALLFTFGLVLWMIEPNQTTPSSSNNNYNSYNSVSNYNDNDDNQNSPGSVVMIQACIFAIVSGCVYFAYRRFIPFAISTLKVAGMAVRSNRGLYVLSAFMPFALSGWFLLWSIALVGVFSSASTDPTTTTTTTTTANDDYNGDDTGPNGLLVLILLFSFYWGYHVIRNVFHTTTAGTIGAWWFTPLADPTLCSLEVTDSLQRSLTYSFGSICFGSLIVAIIQTLEQMAKSARGNNNNNRNGGAALLACIIECILHLLRRWVEYFNSWAFCYVGLYGYDFLTAGKNVVSLFTNRGWSTFASDRLVFRVLYFANLGIAILSGGVACLVDVVAGPLFPSLPADDNGVNGDEDDMDAESFSIWVAFIIGCFVGAILSSTALFVMESAVRTVIVCFAESPSEFNEFHPDLCQLMRDGWAQAYPEQWETASTPIVWAATATRAKNDSQGEEENNGLVVTATASIVPGQHYYDDHDQRGPSLFAKEKDGLFRD